MDPLRMVSLAFLWGSTLAIVTSVIFKFTEYGKTRRTIAVKEHHWVETFSMTAVIIAETMLLWRGVGVCRTDDTTRLFWLVFGGTLVIIASVLHVLAKIELGKFWSNQMEILEDHRIVTTGAYSAVRHPMYSSLILWLLGLSFMFMNWAVFLATASVFAPMMIFRANAEDRLLRKADPTGFAVYRESVHQLVPRFPQPVSLGLRCLVILTLGYSIITRQMFPDRVVFLFTAHLMAGLLSSVPKVRFSYINKSFIMLAIFGAARPFPQAAWLYWLLLVFDIWGLLFDCPCMLIYEKYHGCPCLNIAKKCLCARAK